MHDVLDRVLHQPIRTRIMAYLLVSGSCTYSGLKTMFDLSDGHMTTHMRELLEHEYVEMKKHLLPISHKRRITLRSKGRKLFLIISPF
ncbi:transcriptional regulator [bacterium]|nr:MAG: transcriptional regulator [bacterium]